MSTEQEQQKREKEITEQKMELESLRKELEREKQRPPTEPKVLSMHSYVCFAHDVSCFVLPMQSQLTGTDSQSLEILSLQAFSNVSSRYTTE